jgi:hypothetical protein
MTYEIFVWGHYGTIDVYDLTSLESAKKLYNTLFNGMDDAGVEDMPPSIVDTETLEQTLKEIDILLDLLEEQCFIGETDQFESLMFTNFE